MKCERIFPARATVQGLHPRRGWLMSAVGLFGLLILGVAVCAAQERLESDYRLGPEDVVQITIWKRADLSGQFAVDPDGRISLSLLGKVAAEGKTVADLETELTRRYAMIDPSISDVVVSITGYFSRKVTVLGEVRSPGPRSFVDIPPIGDVILAAGGATPVADLKRVEVVRRNPRPGADKRLLLDLSQGKGDSALAARLFPGDVVVVPALTSPALQGTVDERVQVIGAVKTPGFHDAASVGTVMGALGAAGGTLDGADLKKVSVVRRTADGSLVVYNLNLRKYLEEGYPDLNITLEKGDVVNVPSKGGKVVETFFRIVPLATALTSLFIALDR